MLMGILIVKMFHDFSNWIMTMLNHTLTYTLETKTVCIIDEKIHEQKMNGVVSCHAWQTFQFDSIKKS